MSNCVTLHPSFRHKSKCPEIFRDINARVDLLSTKIIAKKSVKKNYGYCQMEYTQILLFEEPLDIKVKNELKKLKDSNDRSRKAQFAKIGEIRKRCDDLEERLAIIERGICKADFTLTLTHDMMMKNQPRLQNENSYLCPIFINSSWMQLFHQPSTY